MKLLDRAIAAALVVSSLTTCSEAPIEKNTAPVFVLVLVDGVLGTDAADDWAAALGSDAWWGEAGAVSTSAAATLASVLTGLEPPEHRLFSARDGGQAFRDETFVQVLHADFENPWARRVAACVPRALMPELVGLDADFESWTMVRGGELGAALDALQPAIEEAHTSTRGALVLAIESLPSMRGAQRWPPGLEADIEREVSPLVTARSDAPEPADFESWYSRPWIADEHIGPALERAFSAAHQRRLCERLERLAQHLASRRVDWCITVAGLVPANVQHFTGTSATLPIASRGAPRALERVGELVDIAPAVLRRFGHEGRAGRAPRAVPTELGLWNARGGLRGSRARWTAVDGPLGDVLCEPPVRALCIENIASDTPVHVEITALEPCVVTEPLGELSERIEFDLARGERRSVHFDRAAPALLLELSSAGRALREEDVCYGRDTWGHAALATVLDVRPAELATESEEVDREAFVWIERVAVGRFHVQSRSFGTPTVETWPPSVAPIAVEPLPGVESDFAFALPSSARFSLLFRRSGEAADRSVPLERLRFDGRAFEPTRLRLLWPPRESEPASILDWPPQHQLVEVTRAGDMDLFWRPPRDLRGLLQSLLSHE